jgi:hypothetical protein
MDHQRLVNTEQTKTPPKNKWFDGAVAPDGDRDLVSASPQLSFCATTFSVSHIVGSPRDDKGCRLSEYKKPSQCTSCDCPHGKKKILLQGPVPVTSLGLAMLLSPKLLAGDAALRASRRQLVTTSKLTPAMSPKCQPIAENGDGVEAISVGDAQHAQRRPVPRASKPFIPVLQEDTPDIPGVVKDAPASLLASDALASGDAAVNSVLRELSPSKSHLSPPPLRISAAVVRCISFAVAGTPLFVILLSVFVACSSRRARCWSTFHRRLVQPGLLVTVRLSMSEAHRRWLCGRRHVV